MSFLHPIRFLLLLAPVVFVGLYLLYWAWKNRLRSRIGEGTLVDAMMHSRSGRRDVTAFVLMLVAIVLLVFALAGPQWGEKQRKVGRKGVDIVFALDISRSMQAEDVPPSRLEAARAEIDRILSRLTGDRVGLVAFAGIAFSQCPLTSDYRAIRAFLRRLEPEDLPVQGTAVGRALGEAISLLRGQRDWDEPGRNDGESTQAGRTMTRGHDQIVVLISDGEDHETAPEEVAAEALDDGIRVFTVPIGTEEGAQVPRYSRDGRRTGALRDRMGDLVISRRNTEGMEQIASVGGGMMIPYAGEGSVASVLAREVDRLQAAELEDILRPEREDRFYFFVAPALILLFLSALLSDRRRRIPHIGWTSCLAFALTAAVLSAGCSDTFVFESDQVEESLEASRQGDTQTALEQIREFRRELAPEDLLDERALTYNEGVVSLRAGELDQAKQNFLTALGSSQDEVRFRSYYNLGNIAFAQEQFEEAQDRYIQALQIRPEDEDTKWNLEVTLRRLFPPCTELDDAHEENDSASEANPLPAFAFEETPGGSGLMPSGLMPGGAAPRGAAPGGGAIGSPSGSQAGQGEENQQDVLVLCGMDADWYVVEHPHLVEGARVSIHVRFERLREDTGGAALPEEIPPEAIRLALYEADGVTELAVDQGEALLESERTRMDARRFDRHLDDIVIPPGALQAGHLLVEIDAYMGLEYTYDIGLRIIPPCSILEDALEENDTRPAAAELEPGELPLQMCAGDDDWFRFSAQPGDTMFIDIQPGPDTSARFDVHGSAAGGNQVQGSRATGADRPQRGGSAEDRGGEATGTAQEEHSVALRAELYRAGEEAPMQVVFGRDGLLELALFEPLEPIDLELKVSAIESTGEGAYVLSYYLFPPCIVGDDPYEENDEPSAMRPLDPNLGPYRHLRICEGDDDWFRVELEEEQAFSVAVEYEEEDRNLGLIMTPPDDPERVLAVGTEVQAVPVPPRPDNDLSPPPPRARFATVISEEAKETTGYPIWISGDPGFYNLVVPTPHQNASDESCDNPQDQQDQQEQQDQGDQDQRQEDQQEDQDQQEPQDQQAREEPEWEPGDEQEQRDQQAQQLESQEEQAGEMSEEAARERLERLLESLAEEDMNLQLMQALEQIPPVPTDREW